MHEDGQPRGPPQVATRPPALTPQAFDDCFRVPGTVSGEQACQLMATAG